MSNHTPIQLPLAIDGLTVEIPLTQGYVALVDAIDADLAGFPWCVDATSPGLVYAVRFRNIRMHRVILARALGRALDSAEHVDHINGNTLLNARSNLRVATVGENRRNKRVYKNNTSGVRGVVWNKPNKAWSVQLNANGVRYYLGLYKNLDDAIVARLAAEREYFGEFAPSLSREQ